MADSTITPRTAIEAVAALLAQTSDGPPTSLEAIGSFGRYEGLPPRIALDPNGRSATLLAPLTYFGPDGADWPVPEGAWLDGASIPPLLWSLIGGPFEGKYRDASIVHDHYCITHSRSWQQTHRMFHDAMRCSGVGAARASVMYYAVYRFGPRWSVLEALAEAPETFDGNTAESFFYDAEAIIRHALPPQAIAALAESRALQSRSNHAALEGVAEAASAAPSRAQLLVVPGGSGTPEDVAAVVAGAARLPGWMIDHFLARKIRIVACRGSVTDFERDLRGKVPRGWEGLGKTWDDVPGTYFQNKRRVVIATIAQDGARVVPGKVSGLHGSDDLVVHESLHGYDYSTDHAVLAAPSFVTARDADAAALPDYERQPGQAGLEETFAESGAQFCLDRATMAARYPTLADFWNTMPIATETPPAPAEASEAPVPLGVATRLPDRGILLDLRATDESGAIGHASIAIPPDQPAHAALESRLFADAPLEALAEAPQHAVFFGIPSSSGRDKMTLNPLESIGAADIGLDPALEGIEAPPPQLDMSTLPDVVVSGTALIDFSAANAPTVRSSVSLALLFASRVATRAMRDGDDEDDWLASYTKALGDIGFRVSGFSMIHSQLKKKNVAVHKAIIPFLTMAFGGAVAVGPVILSLLNNLQQINADSPWITLFDQQSRRFDVNEMHFAAVSSNEVETTIRYAIARLHVETGGVQVLFFKFSSTKAQFDSTTTTMTCDNGLLATIEPQLKQKLLAIIDSAIASAEI